MERTPHLGEVADGLAVGSDGGDVGRGQAGIGDDAPRTRGKTPGQLRVEGGIFAEGLGARVETGRQSMDPLSKRRVEGILAKGHEAKGSSGGAIGPLHQRGIDSIRGSPRHQTDDVHGAILTLRDAAARRKRPSKRGSDD